MCARAAWTIAATLALAGCDPGVDPVSPEPEPPERDPLASPVQVVRNQIHAFNEHDVEAMTALVAPDVAWLAIDGDQITVEARGRDELAETMTDYFASVTDVTTTVEVTLVAGDRVAVRERATWTDPQGETRSKVALAVYEVRDGLIQRVWYFPTQPAGNKQP